MRRFHVESSHTHVVGRAGEVRDPADLSTDSVMRSRIKRTCPSDALVLAHLPLGNQRKRRQHHHGAVWSRLLSQGLSEGEINGESNETLLSDTELWVG